MTSQTPKFLRESNDIIARGLSKPFDRHLQHFVDSVVWRVPHSVSRVPVQHPTRQFNSRGGRGDSGRGESSHHESDMMYFFRVTSAIALGASKKHGVPELSLSIRHFPKHSINPL